jgi:hypothetical protein
VITRRNLVIALGSSALARPLVVLAQPQGKAWRIGFLGIETAAGYAKELDAFRGGLKDFGYIEGRNVVIEYRWAEGMNDRLPQLAAELLRKGDVLVWNQVCVPHTVPATVPSSRRLLGSICFAGFAEPAPVGGVSRGCCRSVRRWLETAGS